MTEMRSYQEWAIDFVGDPGSFGRRGEMIRDFLIEEGMTPNSNVLEIGCGCLEESVHLVRHLAPGHYAGIEPSGWLVNAGMEMFPDLQSRAPRFSWRTDFDAGEFGLQFDFVVCHSVMSHMAHWQLPLALANVRAVVGEGAKWLASYRRGEENSYAKEWVYPGVSTFRLDTIRAYAYHAGWHALGRDDLKQRLSAECPADLHDWVRLLAIAPSAEMNEVRLAEEEIERVELETREIAETLYVERMKALDEDWVARLRS